MADDEQPARTPPPSDAPGPSEPRPSTAPRQPGQGRRGGGRERQAGPDDPGKRRRAPGSERRPGASARAGTVFADGIERAICTSFDHVIPPDFPVQHRTGAATLRVTVVARRAGALLLCDSAHAGPHRWPDGEPVGDPDPAPVSVPGVG